jgi:hypothetical protein
VRRACLSRVGAGFPSGILESTQRRTRHSRERLEVSVSQNGKTSRFGERPRTTSLGVQHKHTHTHTKQQLPSRTVVGPDTCLGYSTQGEQTTSIVKFSFVVIVIVLYCGLGATGVIPLWNRHGVFEFGRVGREWGRVSKFVPEARAFTGRFESSYLGLSLPTRDEPCICSANSVSNSGVWAGAHERIAWARFRELVPFPAVIAVAQCRFRKRASR